MKNVFVIGGAALDISGIPSDVCRLRNSNEGRIRVVIGGSAHNISKHLVQMGIPAKLVTVIGTDPRGQVIEADCIMRSIDLTYSLHSESPSATYIRIYDEDYDLLTGINEMHILDELTPAYFEGIMDTVNKGAFCMLDSNLTPEALDYLTHNLTVPFMYEPVSVTKAKRIGDNIGLCHMVKANRFEAAQLSGCSCDTVRGVYRAADWFLNKGVKQIFITLGGDGILFGSSEEIGLVEGEPVDIVTSAGAGDCVSAAIINATLRGKSIREAAENGNRAGAEYCIRWHDMENCF